MWQILYCMGDTETAIRIMTKMARAKIVRGGLRIESNRTVNNMPYSPVTKKNFCSKIFCCGEILNHFTWWEFRKCCPQLSDDENYLCFFNYFNFNRDLFTIINLWNVLECCRQFVEHQKFFHISTFSTKILQHRVLKVKVKLKLKHVKIDLWTFMFTLNKKPFDSQLYWQSYKLFHVTPGTIFSDIYVHCNIVATILSLLVHRARSFCYVLMCRSS